MTFGMFGRFTAHDGRRDELLAILLDAARALEADPGCLLYLVGTSEEPETIWVQEAWTDEAAHDASLEPEEVRATIARAMPLIAGISDSTRLELHGGKGLPA